MADSVQHIIKSEDRFFMNMACDIACENVGRGGEPFGAVIVKDGEVIAAAGSSVTLDNDPTAHAEMNAIRMACRVLHSVKLEGCVIYCSCEPCPMCLGALHWAGVSRIYYANTSAEAGGANFGDDFIYQEITREPMKRSIPCIRIASDKTIAPFTKWADKEDKNEY